MAQYGTNFSEYAAGSLPADFTAGWDGTTPWTVELVAGSTSGKALVTVVPDLGGTGDHNSCLWTALGTFTDMETLIHWKMSTAPTNSVGAALVRAGAGAPIVAYAVREHATQVRLTEWSGGEIDIDTAAYNVSGNAYYWMRMTAAGTSLTGKIWKDDGTLEADATVVSGTDATLLSGYAGVSIYQDQRTYTFDFIGVGTAGDIAPSSATIYGNNPGKSGGAPGRGRGNPNPGSGGKGIGGGKGGGGIGEGGSFAYNKRIRTR